MKLALFELVVLTRDLPEHGLCKGDLGTVVHLHEASGAEVEFMTVKGRTVAVVTVTTTDVRPVEDGDRMSVRTA